MIDIDDIEARVLSITMDTTDPQQITLTGNQMSEIFRLAKIGQLQKVISDQDDHTIKQLEAVAAQLAEALAGLLEFAEHAYTAGEFGYVREALEAWRALK